MELIDELDFTADDATSLKELIPQLSTDNPKSESAGMKVKRIGGKLAKKGQEVFWKVLTEVITAKAKRDMGLD